MKLKIIFISILIFQNFVFTATDFESDELDFYVQGQDLNASLFAINNSICFLVLGVYKGALYNQDPYKVHTSDGYCQKAFLEDKKLKDSSLLNQSIGTGEMNVETGNFLNINFNEAIFDIDATGPMSETDPLKVKVWSHINRGSEDGKRLPMKIWYDFTARKLNCTKERIAAGIECTKFGNYTVYTSFAPSTNTWEDLEDGFKHLGLNQADKTAGMSYIDVRDTTINFVAHQGDKSFNLSLKSEGDVSTGVFEKWRFMGTSPWNIGYMFYNNYAKGVSCMKYKYADFLIYIYPFNEAIGFADPNHASQYNFMDAVNKSGPKKVKNIQDYYPTSIVSDTDTFYQNILNNQYPGATKFGPTGSGEINEACYTMEKTTANKIVDYYGVYDSNGKRIDLENRPFSIMATAQGANDFPDSKMYSFASHHGVWLDYRFKSYVDENTEWTAYGPNVPASAAGKKFTLKENFLSAEKVTLIYSALNSIDKHQVQMWFYDVHWDAEFKNLGFCGRDGQDKDGNACTFVQEHIGYYDKNLDIDGNSATKGGFVFDKTFSCDNSGCTETVLTGANIKRFENSQWLSTMVKTYGSSDYVRELHLYNRDTHSHLSIKENTLRNPTSNSAANGLKEEVRRPVSLSDLPTALYCLENCISPSALNSTFDSALDAAKDIDENANQTWACSNLAANGTCLSPRAAFSSVHYEVGPYIKSSEVDGSGNLVIDRNHDSTPDYTETNAANRYWDGIRDSQKITYTRSGDEIYVGAITPTNQLTFHTNASAVDNNKSRILGQTNIYAYLEGAKISNRHGHETNLVWGIWGGRLLPSSSLAQAECDKTFHDWDADTNSFDEYEYRPSWNEAQSGETRYCTQKLRDGSVTEWYHLNVQVAPRYDLMDGTNAVTFDSPKIFNFTVPSTSDYPTEEQGKNYRLHFTGDERYGLQGIPNHRIDLMTGDAVSPAEPWTNSHRWVPKFVIGNGATVNEVDSITGQETGNTFRIRPLRGQAFLKPLTKDQALTLIGGGITDIPYDTNAAIASTDNLRDLSPSGGGNSIGATPTTLLNNSPCIVDGVPATEVCTTFPAWSIAPSN